MTIPQPLPLADFLRPSEVAALLGLSVRTVGRLRDAGELAAVWVGGRCLIPRCAYEQYRDALLVQAGVPVPLPMRRRGRPAKGAG